MSAHGPAPRLRLGAAFLVGNLVLLLPNLTRALIGDIPWELAAYLVTVSALTQLVALLLLRAVHRRAFVRGISVRSTVLVSLLAAFPAMLLCTSIDEVVSSHWLVLDDLPPFVPHSFGSMLLLSAGDAAAASVLLAAVVYLPAIAGAHRERERELERVRHEAELLRARTQLEPHFVLNTLNAVAGLVEDEPATARELLAALGDLFRDATALREEHPLEAEFAWLQRYASIHELRYPDQLKVEFALSPEVAQVAIPALLTQPLVENAIKHGALRGEGHVGVRAELDPDTGYVRVRIEDDGPELGVPRAGGRGLELTRRRIELAGLPASALSLRREGSRTRAELRLPQASALAAASATQHGAQDG